MAMSLLGFGTAVPPFGVTQAESVEAAKQFASMDETAQRILPVLYRKSGVSKRFSAIFQSSEGAAFNRQTLFPSYRGDADRGPTTGQRMNYYEAHAGGLAVQSAMRALHSSRIKPREMTHLITASCSGFGAPGFDIDLIEKLELAPDVARTHIGFMGCHAAMNALRVAHAFTESEPHARVLVCATELCTLHCQYGWDPDAVLTNALFADGSASVVAMNDRATTDSWQLQRSGSVLIPHSRDAMTWRVGDHGFEMTLSARVPELIAQHLKPWLERWLSESGLDIGKVGSWAVHPGGPRILQAVGETLELPGSALDASRWVLSEFGNMSSPTILFVLDRLRSQGSRLPCVALGFGPGLVAEAMLIR